MKKPVTLIALIALAGGLSAQTHYWVDAGKGLDSNPGTKTAPFQTIAFGLTRATSSAVLHVMPGIYSAVTNGERLPISMGDPTNSHQKVAVIGEDPLTCIIDMGSDGTAKPWSAQGKPNKNGFEPALAINSMALDVEIAKLQFRNGPGTDPTNSDGWWHQCLQVNNGATNIDIHDCIFRKVNRGLWMWGAPQNVAAHDNLFLENWNDASGSNVTSAASNLYIFNNLFVEAGASGTGNGMWPSDQCATMYIVNNIAYKPNNYGYRTGTLPTGMQFENNCAFGYTNGPWYFGTTTVSATNITNDPLLVNPVSDPAKGDYHLGTGSPCIETGYPKGIAVTRVAISYMINDFFGNARVQDSDDDRVAVADMGIHEVEDVTLSVTNWGQGKTALFSVARKGSFPYPGLFLVSLGKMSLVVDTFGSIGVDPFKLFFIYTMPSAIPTVVPLPMPQDPALDGLGLYFQALGFRPVSGGFTWKPSGLLELYL